MRGIWAACSPSPARRAPGGLAETQKAPPDNQHLSGSQAEGLQIRGALGVREGVQEKNRGPAGRPRAPGPAEQTPEPPGCGMTTLPNLEGNSADLCSGEARPGGGGQRGRG